MKKIAAFILFIGVLDSISAQSTLTLDSCRALALSNNKELRISAEKITAAHYEKKAAFTNYLPKIAAIGTYMRTQKEIWLSGNFWLVSFKISYLCLPLFYETRTTPSCHPSGCAYRQL